MARQITYPKNHDVLEIGRGSVTSRPWAACANWDCVRRTRTYSQHIQCSLVSKEKEKGKGEGWGGESGGQRERENMKERLRESERRPVWARLGGTLLGVYKVLS